LSWAAGAEGLPWASATLETVVGAVTAAASRASHVMIPGAARRASRRAKASCMFASSPKRAQDQTLTKVNGDRIDRDCPRRSHFAEFGQVGTKCRRDLT
jgi:hypothetical protein